MKPCQRSLRIILLPPHELNYLYTHTLHITCRYTHIHYILHVDMHTYITYYMQMYMCILVHQEFINSWCIHTFNYNMIRSSTFSSSGGRGQREVLSLATWRTFWWPASLETRFVMVTTTPQNMIAAPLFLCRQHTWCHDFLSTMFAMLVSGRCEWK